MCDFVVCTLRKHLLEPIKFKDLKHEKKTYMSGWICICSTNKWNTYIAKISRNQILEKKVLLLDLFLAKTPWWGSEFNFNSQNWQICTKTWRYLILSMQMSKNVLICIIIFIMQLVYMYLHRRYFLSFRSITRKWSVNFVRGLFVTYNHC